MPDDHWKTAWDGVVARVGEELGDDVVRYGSDRVEAGAIRRYLEPLEFDCPLHYDAEVARAHGHAGITAPYTAINTLAMPALWRPGMSLFASQDRNAQPARSPSRPLLPKEKPPFTDRFATDIEIEWLRPIVVGDRLGRRGNKLVACEPKETRVGRGAFLMFENEIVDEAGETVARMRYGMYAYNRHPHSRS